MALATRKRKEIKMETTLEKELQKRILILDGAMGTMIQRYKLTEVDYRGAQFADWKSSLKGNNDLLCITQADIIRQIHAEYLEAGADIIETCSFNAQTISMADYGMEGIVKDINRAAVSVARSIADEYTAKNPAKPRFVAGSIGPTNKTASMSADVNDPGSRSVNFDELVVAYQEQMEVLLDGGIDVFLIETIFDTLNAKAAIYAAEEAMKATGKRVPIMLSATVADKSGRTLSGQTLRAFMASVSQANILSIGLNCSFGAKDLKPYLEELSEHAACYVSAYPNAGLPNQFGEYDETPAKMAEQVKEYIDEKLINIIGGCCGTSPGHIAEYQKLIQGAEVRTLAAKSNVTELSGLEVFEIKPEINFVNIGERCNVAGSRKFLRLINEKKYEEALQIARAQVEDGAQIIDINMDDAMLESKHEMVTFLNLLASEPEIARLPIMIDSSKWEVIEAGLKCIQGKAVVNSISLKEGEDAFVKYATQIMRYGAAAVIMAFDEKGQADSFERKKEICSRAYNILTEKVGFPAQDIIFDPNILAVATGIEEHNNYGVDFINICTWIKENLPLAKISGGVSNLSFSFRGNDPVREAIHSVFLFHAVKAGMDMGIVNAGSLQMYDEIPADLLACCEDVVLNRRPDATERLVELAETVKNQEAGVKEEKVDAWRIGTVQERLAHSLMKGVSTHLEEDLTEALELYPTALDIIEQPLMDGMNIVGELFGEGKMFLPQVVKTARTMKQAVAFLQPIIEEQKTVGQNTSAGKMLIATVKGDVHDIGKNIVSVIMACNNYEVIDLGVMVSTERIIEEAIAQKVDMIGLSGLITPSLEEMCHVATHMQKAGLTIPLLIGGATTSKIHTAVKIAPNYNAPVVYVKDASQNITILSQLFNKNTQATFLSDLSNEYQALRDKRQATVSLTGLEEARKHKPNLF
jgi:5-methyltetrahydrofolate--homocysteine methyltransferase